MLLLEKIILENIQKYANNLRKPKYNNEFYLKHIIYVLKTGIQWNQLNVKCHYTTIYKKFIDWSNKGIFKISWEQLNNIYVTKKLNQDHKWFKNLLIDSSMIKNYKGIDCIGKNHYDRNRKATKLSIICDQNKVPISVSFYGANIHDTKTIEESIKNINQNIFVDKRNTINIVGDKGYIINDNHKKIIYNRYKINIVTPYRKNQNKKNNKNEKRILKERYKIEHVFNDLDKFKYIKDRQNKYIKYYESFLYLGLIIKFHNK